MPKPIPIPPPPEGLTPAGHLRIVITVDTAIESTRVRAGQVVDASLANARVLLVMGKALEFHEHTQQEPAPQPDGTSPAGKSKDQNDRGPNKPLRRQRPAG